MVRLSRPATRTILLGLGLLIATPSTAQMGPGGGGRSGGGGRHGGMPPGGRPGGMQAAPKPLTREHLDKVVTAMFKAADANGDGIVTVDEVRSRVEARRAALIRSRFERIDQDHNGALSLAEFLAWQTQMGSLASSEQQGNDAVVAESIAPKLDDSPADRLLGRLIEPLGATTVVNANTNYDAGASLDELLI